VRPASASSLTLKQVFQLSVDALAYTQAMTGPALQKCAGLLARLGLDTPFLKARDLHGGVERLRLVLGWD
jgi:hypothetical protein